MASSEERWSVYLGFLGECPKRVVEGHLHCYAIIHLELTLNIYEGAPSGLENFCEVKRAEIKDKAPKL